MTSRAQGAMEYLMSYGWAILVVIVVGAAMWQLNIFNIGGSTAPTSTGFDELKPLLSTCTMGDDSWYIGLNGFSCHFVNNAGGKIRITDFNVSVDQSTCRFMYLSTNTAFIQMICIDEFGNCLSIRFWHPGQGFCNPGSQPNCIFELASGESFVIATLSTPSGAHAVGYCSDIETGRGNEITIDIESELEVGGVTINKPSNGRIHVVGN